MTVRRPMTVSPLWLQGSIVTFMIGFTLLAFSAIRIYQDYAPVTERVVDGMRESCLPAPHDLLPFQCSC